MANNRIYDTQGLGKAIGDGLMEGWEYKAKRKDKERELLRQQAVDDLAGIDLNQRRKVDASGNTIGYETDQVLFDKDKEYVRKNLPGYKKPSGPTEIVSYQQRMQEQGLDPTTGEAMKPAPLLQNQNEVKAKETAAQREFDMAQGALDSQEAEKDRAHDVAKTEATNKMKLSSVGVPDKPGSVRRQYDPENKQLVGQDEQGNPIYKTPVNYGVTFDDAEVTAEAPKEPVGVDPSMVNSVPPPIQVAAQEPDPLDVSPALLKRLREQVSTPSVNRLGERDGSIADLAEFTPEQKIDLGLKPDDMRKVPWSYLSRLEAAKTGGAAKGVDPASYALAREVRSGQTDLGTALEELSSITGRPATKDEINFLSGRDYQAGIEGRADKNRAFQKSQAEGRYSRGDRKEIGSIVDKATQRYISQYKGELDEIQAAKTVRELLRDGKTSGKEQMIATMLVRMSGQAGNSISNTDLKGVTGQTGWAEKAEQLISRVSNEGLSPQNVKLVRKMADDFEKAAKKVMQAKTAAVRRSAVAQLSDYMTPAEAADRVDAAIDPDELIGSLDEAYAGEEGAPVSKGRTPQAPVKSMNVPNNDREASAKRLGMQRTHGKDVLAKIDAPNPDVKEWANEHKIPYDQAEAYLRKRGDIK